MEAAAMLPALTPTYTASERSLGRRPVKPERRIQLARNRGSPPHTNNASASRTVGTHAASSMLGSAESSRSPNDFQPKSDNGDGAFLLSARQAMNGPPGKG